MKIFVGHLWSLFKWFMLKYLIVELIKKLQNLIVKMNLGNNFRRNDFEWKLTDDSHHCEMKCILRKTIDILQSIKLIILLKMPIFCYCEQIKWATNIFASRLHAFASESLLFSLLQMKRINIYISTHKISVRSRLWCVQYFHLVWFRFAFSGAIECYIHWDPID